MNICIVGQYPPQVGGVSTYAKQLEEKLSEEGHNVYILTYKQDAQVSDNVYVAKSLNIPIIRGFSFIISSYFMLNKIVKKHDIDIIHANYILPPGLVSVLNKSNAKKIITIHGSDINILPNNKILRPILKFILNKADALYFVSEKLEEKAINLCGENITKKSFITPNTVNTNKFKPKHEKTSNKNNIPTVTFIGNLVEQKGLQYLLEAKKISNTKYNLQIYGDGPQKELLQKYIETNNLKNTKLMGKTREPEKIIPKTDIMVLPSLSEGASIVALESMSCAKALIATDTGNISNIITDNVDGIIVPTKNPKALSEAIDKLVTNEQEREKIGQNARKLIVNKYSKMNIPYSN
ncbi:glycosyltransferase family 4 protein [Methanosphaera sp. ISO3-F5]|uniref:glycosyltransferase family 4 protein n=1 Tax=Methanosphaera sp. ISO3-F5 TaxID=1452353 RepID=UPI002B2640B6|nr:glycosyltransferase family 4 protein [Methanosphaera sp. ISO3-F5]WQH65010.1 glycosyltransferase family 4 protein [Methanosphaera sp. ISO3-F5]